MRKKKQTETCPRMSTFGVKTLCSVQLGPPITYEIFINEKSTQNYGVDQFNSGST